MSNHNEQSVETFRKPGHEIDPIYIQRWSPRSFLDKAVSEAILHQILEAARWAPSGSNLQPWRFIIAQTPQELATFYPFINEGNRSWCEKAPVLTLIISHTLTAKGQPNRSHAFDAGTAWGYLALEASRLGLVTHAMGGFDRDLARSTLQVPEDYDIHAVVAIGYRGDKDQLPESMQTREFPSDRRPLDKSIYHGTFGVSPADSAKL